MALIIAAATFGSLLIVRHQLESQVTQDLSRDLAHSVATFENLQTQRLNALERENALMADLPSLKALMTTSDAATIEDAGVRFWKVSDSDLFALADNQGHVVAAYAKGVHGGAQLATNVDHLFERPAPRYLVSSDRLYACSVLPLYSGTEEDGVLLGYVISGFQIGPELLRQISQATAVEAVFLGRGRALTSTLDDETLRAMMRAPVPLANDLDAPVSVRLGNERYISATRNLAASAPDPLQLVVLKSFAPAEASIRQIDRLVLFAGFLALIVGTLLMFWLSRSVTRPLENLATGVRAFGLGDSSHLLPSEGTREVRELSLAFARMRDEIMRTNQALLEAERLATIGRMASSVSHDLRHYLASVYANSEFLASSPLSEHERIEILSDIRTAVHGTTELIESMLIFSRTGAAIRRSHELVAALLERATTLLRAHPDAAGVQLVATYCDPADTAALVDGKQVERAIYNLLLNACQSARTGQLEPKVDARLKVQEGTIIIEVQDNGPGVPEGIRTSLFQPFVSEGKQKGSGLGLTLAQSIAAEHGGEVILVETSSGETIFRMTLARGIVQQAASEDTSQKRWAAG
ncbi:sensor histidine kinase [Occallatibacter savannae]|uniref:sensor histidine kinase n=1 Tax=Occallatibacter savannae TaxID=1002691 RepID=UPI001EF6C38E|nr:ATP-binding protein [Occallatibacter savannae]